VDKSLKVAADVVTPKLKKTRTKKARVTYVVV